MPHQSTTLNLFPDPDELTEALADVLHDYTWKSYTIIYENRESLLRLKDILQVHNRRSRDVKLRQLHDNYEEILNEIHSRGETNIVLDISTDKIIPFLREAERVKMLGDYNRFFITNLDMHTLNLGKLSETPANITCLRIVDTQSDKLNNSLINWRQQDRRMRLKADQITIEAALIYDGVHLFWDAFQNYSSRVRKLPKFQQICSEPKKGGKNTFGEKLIEMMGMERSEIYEGASGKVFFDQTTKTRVNFQLEILELSGGNFTRIGSWDKHEKVKYDRDLAAVEAQIVESIVSKRFKIVSKRSEPFFMYRNSSEEEPLVGNDRFEGYVVDLIIELQKVLKFEYDLEEIPDNQYGSKDPNTKQWNGIVKHLLERKADLGVADMSITYERKTAVDFTAPFMNLGIGILYKKPEEKETRLFSFLDPFDTSVWLYTGLSFISISFLLFLVSRINSDDWEPTHPCNQEPEEVESIWNIMNCVWLSMGSIMGQGAYELTLN